MVNKDQLFPDSIEAAKKIQNEMAKSVILTDDFPQPLRYIAGMDVSNNPYDPKK